MIVATAGHIDHGKTALVKALTGVDADRLPEEKARGITLDLGFAYAPEGGLLRVPLGFVDVPGHERLVRTMVAGATGVACALIVVAADDGVMPQTREHVAILDLLGIDTGVVAVTKADRVGPDRVAAVTAEIGALLAGTRLDAVPMVACSALTGVGVDELARLLEAAANPHVPDDAGRGFRLAVDRRFTVSGAGLVVTGAVHAGTVRVGDRLLVSPGSCEVRVRGVRVHDTVADTARAGERCALNLAGPRLSPEQVSRGAWILAPDLHGPATRLDVSLRVLPHEVRSLRHRTPVQLHLGTIAVTGRLLLAGGEAVEPGASAHALITLDREVGTLAGDRFVLRDVSATRTLGGGRVIDVDGPRRGPWTPGRRAVVAAMDTPDDAKALHGLLGASEAGVDLTRFARLRNLPAATLDALVAEAGAVVEPGRRIAFQGARVAALAAGVVSELARAHMAQPDNPGLSPDEIAAAVPASERPALPAAIDELVRTCRLARRGPLLHLPDHVARLRPADAALYEAARAVLEEAGLDQPRLTVVADRLGREADDLRHLLDKAGRLGWLLRISKSYYVLPEAAIELARIADAVANAHPEGLLTVGRFRETAGIGRNMTMPLLEFFDAHGFTVRIAEGRRIRGDWRALVPSEGRPPAH
ncbi:selenocysteine-specific translation elongation factor [Methylobacterium pseudosasicola]|uniref:Selenocysteine-specific translation elongation factor SelB n=1 Tax=Methylobacterium pseudosasicola TaxID=582667 RepID=A0A1I4SIQ3_9HYPH|nr:selenocysteine-specific translation elongation factor [Methylobacterium pseudosasicola]SFM64200.1 selenocysteine-specific translation elongation factor SelB [Methylobacterium pseudosasicola]